MKVDGSVLTVEIGDEVPGGSMPRPRCFLLVMKKMEIAEVVFEKVRR
jgi:hypothetical protein